MVKYNGNIGAENIEAKKFGSKIGKFEKFNGKIIKVEKYDGKIGCKVGKFEKYNGKNWQHSNF